MKARVFFFILIIANIAFSQNTENIKLEKQKVKQALAYGDKVVAASAMHAIVVLEGPQSTYKDSLAYLYFNSRNFVSCFLVTNDILKNKPNNLELLEMKAISLESMGVLEQSSETYKTLLSKTNSNYHAYKLASLQLTLKKFDEALLSIKKADQFPDTGKLKVTFQVNKNYNQNVDIKAAIAYLEGVIEMSLKRNKEAKLSFERAIKLFPDFVLAKSKLAVLNVEKQ